MAASRVATGPNAEESGYESQTFFPPVFRWMWLRLERAGDRDQNLRERTPPESRVHAYLVFTDNPMALLTLGGGDQRACQKRIKENFFISFVWESVITLS